MNQTTQITRPGLFSNAGFSLLAWSIPLALTFLVTPVLLQYLGNEAYGYYAMILGFLGFAFTTGVARVVIKYVPEFRAAGDDASAVRYAGFAFWVNAAVAALQGLILALAAPLIVDGLLRTPAIWRGPVIASIYLVCIGGPLLAAGQLFQSVLQSRHGFRTVAVITAVNAVFLSAGNVFLAVRGSGMEYLIAWNVVAAAVAAIAFYAAAKKAFPQFSFSLGFDRAMATAVLSFAGSIVVYQAITSLLFIFERAWVLRQFGAEALTFYVIPLMLGMYLHAFVLSMSQAFVPRMNEMLGDLEALERFYRKLTRLALIVIAMLVMHFLSLGEAFLELWLGAEFGLRSMPILVGHTAAFGLIAVGIIAWHTAEAFRKPAINAATSVLLALVAVLVIVAVANNGQIQLVAYARAVGAAVTLPVIFFVERICFGRALFGFWLINAAVLTATASAVGMLQGYAIVLTDASWATLAVIAVAGTLVYLGALFAVRFWDFSSISELRRS